MACPCPASPIHSPVLRHGQSVARLAIAVATRPGQPHLRALLEANGHVARAAQGNRGLRARNRAFGYLHRVLLWSGSPPARAMLPLGCGRCSVDSGDAPVDAGRPIKSKVGDAGGKRHNDPHIDVSREPWGHALRCDCNWPDVAETQLSPLSTVSLALASPPVKVCA